MPKATKKMSREEFKSAVSSARDKFSKAAPALQDLCNILSRSDEFTFSGLESSKRFLDQVSELESAAKAIRSAFILRGRSKVAEECSIFPTGTKKSNEPVSTVSK